MELRGGEGAKARISAFGQRGTQSAESSAQPDLSIPFPCPGPFHSPPSTSGPRCSPSSPLVSVQFSRSVV